MNAPVYSRRRSSPSKSSSPPSTATDDRTVAGSYEHLRSLGTGHGTERIEFSSRAFPRRQDRCDRSVTSPERLVVKLPTRSAEERRAADITAAAHVGQRAGGGRQRTGDERRNKIPRVDSPAGRRNGRAEAPGKCRPASTISTNPDETSHRGPPTTELVSERPSQKRSAIFSHQEQLAATYLTLAAATNLTLMPITRRRPLRVRSPSKRPGRITLAEGSNFG